MCSEIERNFAVCKLACATVRRIDVCVWQGGIVAGCACLLRVRLASQSLPLALLLLLHMLFGHKRGVQPPHSPPSTAAVFVSTPLSLCLSFSLFSVGLSVCPLCALYLSAALFFAHWYWCAASVAVAVVVEECLGGNVNVLPGPALLSLSLYRSISLGTVCTFCKALLLLLYKTPSASLPPSPRRPHHVNALAFLARSSRMIHLWDRGPLK